MRSDVRGCSQVAKHPTVFAATANNGPERKMKIVCASTSCQLEACKVERNMKYVYISVQSTLTLNGRSRDRKNRERCRVTCIGG